MSKAECMFFFQIHAVNSALAEKNANSGLSYGYLFKLVFDRKGIDALQPLLQKKDDLG